MSEEKFPTTKNEFLQLLEKLGAARPDQWVWEGSEFSTEEVLQYLFLRSVWMFMENPNRSTYTPEKVARSRQWSEEAEGRQLKAYVPITEKMLAAGISPQEISTLVYRSQFDLVFQILYMLSDNSVSTPVELDEMGFGLFETKDGKPQDGGWFINDLLAAARPADFPE